MDESLIYPKGERVWKTHYEDGEIQYVVTTKGNNREVYYLYRVKGNSFEKMGKSPSPIELEEKYAATIRKKGR